MAAELTVKVPAEIAEALRRLDAPVSADGIAFADVLRWNVHQVHDELWRISEEADPLDAGELRALAARLEVLADACDALKNEAGD